MIFFDIDRTLLDYDYAISCGMRAFYAQYNAELPQDEMVFQSEWKRLFDHYWDRYAAGELTLEEQRILRVQGIFHSAGIELGHAEALGRMDVFVEAYESNWRLFSDVLPALDLLSSFGKGIISNGFGEQQTKKLERTGILDRFSVIVMSEVCGFWKPDERIFSHAASLAARQNSECFHIGDDLERDALGAQRAGFHALWIDRNPNASKSHEDMPSYSSLEHAAYMILNR